MPRQAGDMQYTEKGKAVGNQLGFALLVDENEQPILDAAGNTQVISFKAGTDGRIKTDATLTGSKVEQAFAITTSDTVALAHQTIAIYVGGYGDLKVTLQSGETVTFKNISEGFYPIVATHVLATGTTATSLIGIY